MYDEPAEVASGIQEWLTNPQKVFGALASAPWVNARVDVKSKTIIKHHLKRLNPVNMFVRDLRCIHCSITFEGK